MIGAQLQVFRDFPEFAVARDEFERMKARGVDVSKLSYRIVGDFFNPSFTDLVKIGNFLGDCEEVVDLGCGSGNLVRQLVIHTTQTRFLGIDTRFFWDKKPKKKPRLSFEFAGVDSLVQTSRFDGVICSWMPINVDWYPNMARLAKKKIVDVQSSLYQTGSPTACSFDLIKYGFVRIEHWNSQDKENEIEFWEKKR